ncbi:MAG: acetyl-CoA C-acetyltransferase [Sedimentisphaerales bacterium]|nr:acetyl-CoA C-acetyltransferase [Sedimentisphaerales bacterium]
MNAYIVSGKRSAIGRFNGSLTTVSLIELGALVIRELIASSSIDAGEVDEVIMGNVLQAGLGQNPARQAAVKAGLPYFVPAFTVNKVCASGLKSVALAAQKVACGEAHVIIAGGMEHMTCAPYLLKDSRWGKRMGNGEMVDSMVCDALWDCFYDCHMGETAENVATKYAISREEQDAFAARSQQKTEKAIAEGKFKDEIVPVTVKQKKAEDLVFDTDEHPRANTTRESLSKLKPAFKKDGTVTAGNASGINDGAGAVIVVSEEKFNELDPEWAFKIIASHSVGLDPAYMGLGPIDASQGVLKKVKCTVRDLDMIEVNESFAATSIQVNRVMGWNLDKVNVLGGAIALGHPVGASGTRILVTLLHEMVRRNVSLGLAALCVGGGQGMAMIVERVT